MLFSSSIKAGWFLLLTAALLISTNVWSGDLSGWFTFNYIWQENQDSSFFSREARIRLNWMASLSNRDVLNLYLQFAHKRKNNPDNREIRPLIGLTLTGPEYSWLMEYNEFQSKILGEGGSTFTNDTFFTTFNFEPSPNFPDLTLNFSKTTSKDDLEDSQIDFEQTDWGLRTTYEVGSLFLRYRHFETDFNNFISTPTTIVLRGVTGVAVDQAGIIYVTDAVANRVFRFSSAGVYLGEFGSDGSGDGQLRDPKGIDVYGEFIYVIDSDNNRVQKFDRTGRYASQWGTFGGGAGNFDSPYGIAVDHTGVYVTDQGNDRVQKFTHNGDFLFQFGRNGSGPGDFLSPSGVASNGRRVVVVDTGNQRVQVFTTGGTFVTERGTFGSGPGQFQFPTDVAFDALDRVYVTDTENDRVQVFTSNGLFLREFGTSGSGPGEFDSPQGIALTLEENVVVADYNNHRFQVLTNTGNFIFEVGAVTGEERARSTQKHSDFFSLFYGRELVKGVYASIDYDFLRSKEEDKDTKEELITELNHLVNGQIRLEPYKWISWVSQYYMKLFDTETRDLELKRDELSHTHILSLQPVPRVNFSASYSRSDLNRNIGRDEDSALTNLSLKLLPTDRISLDFSTVRQENQQDGEKITDADAFTTSANINIFRGIDLNLLYSSGHTKDFEIDSLSDNRRVRGRLRLEPRRNLTLFTHLEYNTQDSQFIADPDINSRTMRTGFDLSWGISRRLDFFWNLDYVNTDSAGITRENLSYLANLIWRMNDKLTIFLGHRGGTDKEDISGFRIQVISPFVWDTRLTVNFDMERGPESRRNGLLLELMKVF